MNGPRFRPRSRPRLPRLVLPFAVLAVLAVLVSACGPRGERITVLAAVSLTEALERAAVAYERDTGVRVDIRLGGSGALGVEIERGAPADIFISASIEWMDHLRDRGFLVEGSPRALAWNTLVAVVPRNTTSLPLTLPALAELDRVALGDPDSVPAGRYARQALEGVGRWDGMTGKLVLTPDVRAALALVERREVDAAIVYATDALKSQKAEVAFFLPERSHDPVVYTGAQLRSAPHPRPASAFLEFLSGPEGREIFRSLGFAGTS